MPRHQDVGGDSSNRGYRFIEASQFIEFCVELNSQDDRLASSASPTHDPKSPKYQPQIDPRLWNPKPIYDSRRAVAKDVVDFKAGVQCEETRPWTKLYRDILSRAAKQPPADWTEDGIANDPRYNGFGPYQNAWLLYEGVNDNRGAYAIAIRGTVFSSKPSVVEDVLFHPVDARMFLSPRVTFAKTAGATLHSGLTHATFSLLLDDRYGVLRVLHDSQVDAGSHLYVVGHSQGAAMATMTHAFFHYAMNDGASSGDVFGLANKNYRLKSYVFGQPKLGNYVFASDFSRLTQSLDNAIVINNDIDPVPQVPLTLQDISDLDGDLSGVSLLAKTLHFIGGIGSAFRGVIGRIAEPIVRKDDAGFGYYYNYSQLGDIGAKYEKIGSSWNFVPAGHVLLVYGTPVKQNDDFLQHHTWMYRDLIRAQLHSDDVGAAGRRKTPEQDREPVEA